jgi:hypothetical protein
MSGNLSNVSIRGPNTPTESIPLLDIPPPEMLTVMHPLPLSGSPEAPPTFNGRNISSFLKKYESIYDNYQIQEAIRLKKVSKYCKDDITRKIEAFTTWEEKD